MTALKADGREHMAVAGLGRGKSEKVVSFSVIFGGTKFRESSEENNAINKTNNKWLCARVLGVQGFSFFFFFFFGQKGFRVFEGFLSHF